MHKSYCSACGLRRRLRRGHHFKRHSNLGCCLFKEHKRQPQLQRLRCSTHKSNYNHNIKPNYGHNLKPNYNLKSNYSHNLKPNYGHNLKPNYKLDNDNYYNSIDCRADSHYVYSLWADYPLLWPDGYGS